MAEITSLEQLQYFYHLFLRKSDILTIFLILFCLFYRWKLRSRSGKKSARLPPGPSPWPIVGNLPEMFLQRSAFRWILGLMKEMNVCIACIRLGKVHVIPVTCPEIAREFLIKDKDSTFASRPITMATEYESRGFLSSATAPWGEQWKKMRRIVASEIMSPARLGWLLDKRTEEADYVVRLLYNQCKSSPTGRILVDVRSTARHYSANVIKRMVFNRRYFGEGSEDGGPGEEEEEHVNAAFTVLSLLYSFCVSDYMPWLRWLDLNGHEKVMKKATGIVNKYHDPVIEGRMEEWRSGIRTKADDVLDVLISLKDGCGKPLLTVEEVKAQCEEMMYAGFDNPSNTAEWTIAEMLNRPELLHKAVAELDTVVGKSRLVQESDIPELNYIKACAREALRLHPIAPFNLPHVAGDDSVVSGYFIPKGSHVLLSRTGLGRNPKVWPDPLRFEPGRHLRQAGGNVSLHEPELRFVSFSTGRRGCAGAALGSAMTIMLLARLLQCFNWSLPDNVSRIDLSESVNDLFMAQPLCAMVTPRLPACLYPPTTNWSGCQMHF